MKQLIFACLLLITMGSCRSSKDYLERNDEDKALSDAIKKINKSADDDNAITAIPVLYTNIQKSHLAKIKVYQSSKDLSRWDNILNEYYALERAYEAVISSTNAFRLITPQSYSAQILETKQAAAEEYYQIGETHISKEGRDNAKRAYTAYKKADKYVSDYKEASARIKQAYDNAIVDVIINPVQDNSFFFNSGWGNSGYNYSNEYFQQTLVRELSTNGDRYPAKFYTDWEARRENIKPDWLVDLRLRNMDIPQPVRNTSRRNVSKQIEIGRDTAGRPQYKTVYATLNITKMSFTARADMEVNIKDVVTGRNISYNNFSDDFRWEQESATYTGDSRALSSNDWDRINNAGYNETPRKEDILNELYRELYPRVKNSITYAVDW